MAAAPMFDAVVNVDVGIAFPFDVLPRVWNNLRNQK